MSDSGPVDPDRRKVVNWLWRVPVLAALGAGVWGAWRYYSVHFERIPASPEPEFETHEAARVALLADFHEPWAAVEFTYAGLPAIALRLPGPVPGGLEAQGVYLAAYSRICTHQACLVELSLDPEAVAFAFNYRSSSPTLVCHCHLSVFEPLRGGEAVSGPALLPLPRIRLGLEGEDVLALGVERT